MPRIPDDVWEGVEAFSTASGAPLNIAAGIAYLESGLDPATVTGSHYGLYQLADPAKKPGTVFEDFQKRGPKELRDTTWAQVLASPRLQGEVAGWEFRRIWRRLRRKVGPGSRPRTDTELWVLAYWAWLAGTSAVPKVANLSVGNTPTAIAKGPQWGAKGKYTTDSDKAEHAEKLTERGWTRVIPRREDIERLLGRVRAKPPMVTGGASPALWLAALFFLLLLWRRRA